MTKLGEVCKHSDHLGSVTLSMTGNKQSRELELERRQEWVEGVVELVIVGLFEVIGPLLDALLSGN